MATQFLVRAGAISEVFRASAEETWELVRDQQVVVETSRGRQMGTVLERVKRSADPHATSEDAAFSIIRPASPDDVARANELAAAAEANFSAWTTRIQEWGLALELVEVEKTLDDEKWILYVLTERGPETTKLALQAAAEGLGTVEVQPVSATGLTAIPSSGGGCGSDGGGCGCSS